MSSFQSRTSSLPLGGAARNVAGAPTGDAVAAAFPRLQAMIDSARSKTRIGLVYPCDALALQAAQNIVDHGVARPILIGPRDAIARAADSAQIDVREFESVDTPADPRATAQSAVAVARTGAVAALMKGSLHTDELMSAVVERGDGLRTETRISHAFVFDLPRYHKLLTVADCVVNIAPTLETKRDILLNTLALLRALHINHPKVAIVAAVETVNPLIAATVDAHAIARSAWDEAVVEGPFGFDNAISAEAARIKGMTSRVAGDPDLLLMPDLNAGNILYKSFIYIGGGECAGVVLGARVPVVLTSRSDSSLARLASVALAVTAVRAQQVSRPINA